METKEAKEAVELTHWYINVAQSLSERTNQLCNKEHRSPTSVASYTPDIIRQCAQDCANASDRKAAIASWYDGFFDQEQGKPHRSDFQYVEENGLHFYTKGWGFSYAYNERPDLPHEEYESMEAYDVH